MTYKFKTDIHPSDFWLLSMYHTYHSVIGMCNLVFAGAMLALSIRFWNEVNVNVQALFVFLCLIIPVFHPIGVWLQAKAQANGSPQGAELIFDEGGLQINFNEKRERIPWKKIRGAKREGSIIVLFTGGGHGYMLTDRMLGKDKEAFFAYVKAHVYEAEKKK